MKILHTADWHLGKRLESFSRMEEQKKVMQEIAGIADHEEVDMVIIAGDLFDAFNPPIEAEELFYLILRQLSANGHRPVLAIAGNHDSPDRIEAPDPLARGMGIFFAGYPSSQIAAVDNGGSFRITQSDEGFAIFSLPGINYPVRVLFTPYANEFRLKAYLGSANEEQAMRDLLQQRWKNLAAKYCDEQGVNILTTHLFMMKEGQEAPEEPEDEKPILHIGGAQAVYTNNIPSQVQYTALGHLHRRHAVDAPEKGVWYSGSPLSYSFSEANQDKFVNIVTLEPGREAVVEPVRLTQGKRLLRKRCEGVEEALKWLQDNQEALVELTLVAEDYLTAEDRKRLQQAHKGIITIVPEIKNMSPENKTKSIDLQQSMETLFGQYFRSRYGQEPNSELMDLFKEIQGEKDNT
ncbi:MAG: exonuclease subunit SbcD [Bacteroidales bacterium]|nr:exonuclease subunit SbcD [Bacteroidales bacterium]